MATEAQFKANRENAQRSTGPRTESGKASSSRNHFVNGLYTKNDFVLPEEVDVYQLFCERFEQSCNAQDAIEECLAHEITSAAWRLRRCNLADGDVAAHSTIDPLLDETLTKQIRSIERARAHSTSVFHRGLNQLRKLQKERFRLEPMPKEETTNTPDPEPEPRPEFLQALQQKIDSIMNCPEPDWDEIDRQIAEKNRTSGQALSPHQPARSEMQESVASNCTSGQAAPAKLASNCKPIPNVGRNTLCPCKSGLKFKRCCLGKAA